MAHYFGTETPAGAEQLGAPENLEVHWALFFFFFGGGGGGGGVFMKL